MLHGRTASRQVPLEWRAAVTAPRTSPARGQTARTGAPLAAYLKPYRPTDHLGLTRTQPAAGRCPVVMRGHCVAQLRARAQAAVVPGEVRGPSAGRCASAFWRELRKGPPTRGGRAYQGPRTVGSRGAGLLVRVHICMCALEQPRWLLAVSMACRTAFLSRHWQDPSRCVGFVATIGAGDRP